MLAEPPELLVLHLCLAHVAVLVLIWLHLLLLCYGCWILAAAVVEGQWQPLHAHKDQAWAVGCALGCRSSVNDDGVLNEADKMASCTPTKARLAKQCCAEVLLRQ
jgi:hypothetical protein